MSGYTIGEIAVWLLLTAVLAFALGWLSRELVLRRRDAAAPPRRDSGVPARDSGVPARDSGVPTRDSGVPARDSGVPARDSGVPTSEPAVTTPSETPAGADVPVVDGPVVDGPHPGSALPLPDGAAPSAEHVVKVSRGSKIFHAPSSPAYARTTAALWFTTEEAAEEAGFRRPKNA